MKHFLAVLVFPLFLSAASVDFGNDLVTMKIEPTGGRIASLKLIHGQELTAVDGLLGDNFTHQDSAKFFLTRLPYEMEKMKNGVIIINNSRGQLIDEDALAESLSSGRVGAAALDVVATEPIQPDNQLLKFDNCLITPHISWAPKESRERLMKTAVENLRAYIEGAPINVVN